MFLWNMANPPSPVVQDNQMSDVIEHQVTTKVEVWLVFLNLITHASNGIEAVSSTPLANNTQIQIALLSSIPSQALTNLLSRMLNHVSVSSLPCLILSDFNEDILHQSDCELYHGYTQWLHQLLEALIDHVYCTSLPGSTIQRHIAMI